jgi:phage shock protein C
MSGGPVRRLYRSRRNRMLFGVAGGLGEYLGVDPTVVRVLWVVGGVLMLPMTGPVALLLYVILALIIPPEPE